MIISAHDALSPVLQEKLLVKFSHQYHALMRITFPDNQQKFASHTTWTLYLLNDWLLNSLYEIVYILNVNSKEHLFQGQTNID